VRWHERTAYPERLSAWGLLTRSGQGLTLAEGVMPYEVATPLFSDYALKLRTVYLPPGTKMRYQAEDAFDFPVGSILSKTFFYPLRHGVATAAESWHGDPTALRRSDYRLIETRLLIRQAHGWDALPYVWDGDDAYLRITGAVQTMTLVTDDGESTLPYVVPARSECAGCHGVDYDDVDHDSGTLSPIGLKARHLNRPYTAGQPGQLQTWAERGWLAGLPGDAELPPAADWQRPGASLEARARAYLDSNCGHCHSPSGPARTSGMLLDASTTSFRALGFCKPPIAAGRGSGGHAYGIVPGQPDASILVFRMETNDPATRMPETGRSVVHRAGVELVRAWIAQLPGACV
jgi:uncharacterized repeat protein (TIGR03806 family)